MNKKKIQNLKLTFRHARILASQTTYYSIVLITFNCLNTSMKNSDMCMQVHLQELWLTSQLKASLLSYFLEKGK